MKLKQIKAAVDAGRVVHWENSLYTIIKDSLGQYLICCSISPQSYVGLTEGLRSGLLCVEAQARAAMKKLLLAAVAAFALAPLPANAATEEDTLTQYSIFEVVKDTPACRPAYSDNCVMLKKGQQVIYAGGVQITERPDGRREGLYCLRASYMKRCGFADLAAIEVAGKRGPVLGMSSEAEEKQANGGAFRPDCSPHTMMPIDRCEPIGDFTNRERKPGELPFCNSEDVQKTFAKVIGSQFIFELKDMQTGQADSTTKRWCYAYFTSPYLPGGGYRMGSPFQEAIFTLEWMNRAENKFWLQVVQQQEHRKHN